jgi:hypothetical protein
LNNFIDPDTENEISAQQIEFNYIKSVLAYDGLPDSNNRKNQIPKGKRKESSDILYGNKLELLSPKSVQPIWLNIHIPNDAKPGRYYGQIFVSADQLTDSINLNYELEVLSAKISIPKKYRKNFDIELWQNPYRFAEYYRVTPFSNEHFELLIPHMKLYKSIGGDAITATITEEAWDGQTYSENDIKFPSMVKWIKNKDGEFEFDYVDFDKWIAFINSLNMGDKIACYSLAPWTNSIFYTDQKNNEFKEISLNPEDSKYEKIWTHFLKDFVEHVESLDIKDRIYMAIDERGLNEKIFEIIHSVKGADGKPLKTAGALDSFVEKREISEYITDLTVGTLPIKEHPKEFKELVEDRKNKGLRTTVYSCTGHIPGNFSLSEPVENYWTILFSYAVGGEGFLRWAYDSWVENPLEDTSHRLFEAGDTFLVYPDEKEAKNPVTKSSIRFEKIAEGIRDVQKLDLLRNLSKKFDKKVSNLLSPLLSYYSSEELYLDTDGKMNLLKDIEEFKKGLNDLTKKAIKSNYFL